MCIIYTAKAKERMSEREREKKLRSWRIDFHLVVIYVLEDTMMIISESLLLLFLGSCYIDIDVVMVHRDIS